MAEFMGVSLKTEKRRSRGSRGPLWAMGEAGGGPLGILPSKTMHGGAGETSPPAFAAPYLHSLFPITLRFLF